MTKKIIPTDAPTLQRIIRRQDLLPYVGLKRTQCEVLIANGEFPKPIPLSDNGRSVGWLESEIIAWQEKRLALRDDEYMKKRRSQNKGNFKSKVETGD